MTDLPLLGISACLTGENLRYDGSGKLNKSVVEYFSKRARLLSVCAEVECGMPVPREPMDLFQTEMGIRLLTVDSRCDLTHQINLWSREKVEKFAELGISGFVFKSGSPSCGVGTARLHRNGSLLNSGTGLFAAVLKIRFPAIPVVEAIDLSTEYRLNRFLYRVKDYKGGARC